MSNLWRLSLNSFQGVVGGASHWQAELIGPSRYRVNYIMTSEDVQRFDKTDQSFSSEVGWNTGRFFSKAEAIRAGAVAFSAMSQPGDCLQRGDRWGTGPDDCLVGPKWFMVCGNEINERYDIANSAVNRHEPGAIKALDRAFDTWSVWMEKKGLVYPDTDRDTYDVQLERIEDGGFKFVQSEKW